MCSCGIIRCSCFSKTVIVGPSRIWVLPPRVHLLPRCEHILPRIAIILCVGLSWRWSWGRWTCIARRRSRILRRRRRRWWRWRTRHARRRWCRIALRSFSLRIGIGPHPRRREVGPCLVWASAKVGLTLPRWRSRSRASSAMAHPPSVVVIFGSLFGVA
jgi:hypothetical protein